MRNENAKRCALFLFLQRNFRNLWDLFFDMFVMVHKKKYWILKENVKITNDKGRISAQQGKTLKLRVLHKK